MVPVCVTILLSSLPPVPRGLLNAYMPGMLTRLLSGLLPVELGAYTGACGEAQALSGELKVAGPSLSTTVANIAPGGKVRGAVQRDGALGQRVELDEEPIAVVQERRALSWLSLHCGGTGGKNKTGVQDAVACGPRWKGVPSF